MYTSVRDKAHQVDIHPVLLGIFECLDDLRILTDRLVAAGAVDLHQILINDTPGTDVEVSDLRVTHLSIGQTDILAVGAQLCMGITACHLRNIGGLHLGDHIPLLSVSDPPSIEDHQQYLLMFHIFPILLFP